MTASQRVLIVDDERDMAESCAFFLRRIGYPVDIATSGEAALQKCERPGDYSVVITDLRMPGMSGIELIERLRASDPHVQVLVITGFPEVETAVAAMRHGALDYIQKPFEEDEFLGRVEKALAHWSVVDKNVELRKRLHRGASERELVYRSEPFGEMVAALERAARTDASVLILGESGTGKELLAHHLHDHSPRAERPFVPVDCATIPESLVESELFGHVKGAFSGADKAKVGLFQVADKGTLFLDEVGELPLSFQPKLLRAIQERQVRRVGASQYEGIDVRIVCATNRNLAQMVDAGDFRQDLFYRLDVVRLDVPPLRERRADIELLVQRFMREHGVPEIAPDALAALVAYGWPGNVRQLGNAIERAAALGAGVRIELEDLPQEIQSGSPTPEVANEDGELETFQSMKARKVAELESGYLRALLSRNDGNVTRSAEEAGMTRSALQKLMQRYGIKSSEFRHGGC